MQHLLPLSLLQQLPLQLLLHPISPSPLLLLYICLVLSLLLMQQQHLQGHRSVKPAASSKRTGSSSRKQMACLQEASTAAKQQYKLVVLLPRQNLQQCGSRLVAAAVRGVERWDPQGDQALVAVPEELTEWLDTPPAAPAASLWLLLPVGTVEVLSGDIFSTCLQQTRTQLGHLIRQQQQ